MGNAYGECGGKTLPQYHTEHQEQPNRGALVHYYFVAGGKDSELLRPMIEESHRQGRRLLTFRKKPLSEYFVGIFREPSGDLEREDQWRLGVLNVWLHGQLRPSLQVQLEGEQKRKLWVMDPLCLADSISHTLRHGERVVSISLTTAQRTYTQKDVPSGVKITPGVTKTVWCPHDDTLPFVRNKARDAVLVEVFYEKPRHQARERYVYNVAAIPVTISHTSNCQLGLANIFCDWSATLNQYLGQGWRLVDILVDFRRPPVSETVESLIMTQFQYKYGSGEDETTVATWKPIDMEILWLFEKPVSREHDPTPVYEGKVIPFAFVASRNNPTVFWDDVIRREGSRGWELACFVERASSCPGPVAPKFYSLLFFQRPLPPPAYTDLESSACATACSRDFSSGDNEKTAL